MLPIIIYIMTAITIFIAIKAILVSIDTIKIANDTIKIFAYIEAAIRKKQLTPEKAVSIIEKNKQEDILQAFDNLAAKELTPELYNMANMIKNKEIGDDGSR